MFVTRVSLIWNLKLMVSNRDPKYPQTSKKFQNHITKNLHPQTVCNIPPPERFFWKGRTSIIRINQTWQNDSNHHLSRSHTFLDELLEFAGSSPVAKSFFDRHQLRHHQDPCRIYIRPANLAGGVPTRKLICAAARFSSNGEPGNPNVICAKPTSWMVIPTWK